VRNGEINLTVVGNLTEDPELRFTPSGAAVASFTVAVNPRTFNRQTNEWADGEPSFVRCVAWQRLAENVCESLRKGDRALVAGRFAEERWEKDGEKRVSWKLTAEAVGAELTWATATPKRARRTNEIPPDDAFATASRTRPPTAAVAQDDPWSTAAPQDPPF
jgi:single-strand DNA-binding protein